MTQVVLVTGCSSGIGLATAVHFAQDELRRFVVYGTILRPLKEEKEFREAAGSALNDTLFPLVLNVTKPGMISRAVSMVTDKHGRIDVVVNNAGIQILKVTETMTEEEAKHLFDINFFGMFRLTREVLPIMKSQMSGRIISISSDMAALAGPHLGMYSSAKFALEGLSEELAVIGRFYNIWVSLIQPGPVKTSLVSNMVAENRGGQEKIIADPNVSVIDKEIASCWNNESEWLKCPEQSPEDVAKVVMKAATDERPHHRYQTSEEVQRIMEVRYKDITGDSQIDFQVERLKPFVKEAKPV